MARSDETAKAGTPVPAKAAAKRPAVCSKYGEVTTSKGAFHPGEPVFILRAADGTSLPMLARYLNHLEQIEDPERKRSTEFLAALRETMEDFTVWQNENRDLVKLPD